MAVEKQTGSPMRDFGVNLGYLTELYDRYVEDPSSVSSEMREFFGQESFSLRPNGVRPRAALAGQSDADIQKSILLINAIRDKGHLLTALDPLARDGSVKPDLTFSAFELGEKTAQSLPLSILSIRQESADDSKTVFEYIEHLRSTYCGTIAYEFSHLRSDDEKNWLYGATEAATYTIKPDSARKRVLLERLLQVEGFERYLHRQFPGQKWFSLEGNDVLIPFLDCIVEKSVQSSVSRLVIGMAHRGRLNVLAHILGKPYSVILGEFEGGQVGSNKPDSSDGWMRDVKYHLGATREYVADQGKSIVIDLLPNASHLELVNPVVSGAAKALQQEVGSGINDALGILIHGDAGFAGEGVVAETLNLAKLSGYSTGGSLHIILNNQIGFTTDPKDTFGTCYTTDLARGFDLPVIHVNADDLESCLSVAQFAFAYRQRFHKDIVVDLVGYRRYGHNEGDEPSFTQPSMYTLIADHLTLATQWGQHLSESGQINPEDIDVMVKGITHDLEEAKGNFQEDFQVDIDAKSMQQLPGLGILSEAPAADLLRVYDQKLHTLPQNFAIHKKLKRHFTKRAQILSKEESLDWAHAEALAFASILDAGISIRLTGQDTERGTFSHRHAVLHDATNEESYTPLQHIVDPQKATFSVVNSPLSEEAALGFEYGYSVYSSNTLVIWEAQFGDFINNAQAIVDELIVSAHAKWGQASGLVLLLPHGYEGMGANHSSAHLERFLQLASCDNIQIVNCTTSAQYFHLLRQQAFSLRQNTKPLVVLAPKSLLRHPVASSPTSDFLTGRFQEIIDDPRVIKDRGKIQKLVLCSGKVYIDLITSDHFVKVSDIAFVRIEQLYPFPDKQLESVLSNYPNSRQIVWLQEEPENRGAWTFIRSKITKMVDNNEEPFYVGRQDFPSPAEGSSLLHKMEQNRIIKTALSKISDEY